MTQLPLGIDADAWDGFCEMRKAYRRPFTDRAATMIVNELAKIEAAGYDPNEALRQSTLHGWLDVFPPKEKRIEKAPGAFMRTEGEKARAQMDKAKRESTAPPERILRMVGKA